MTMKIFVVFLVAGLTFDRVLVGQCPQPVLNGEAPKPALSDVLAYTEYHVGSDSTPLPAGTHLGIVDYRSRLVIDVNSRLLKCVASTDRNVLPQLSGHERARRDAVARLIDSAEAYVRSSWCSRSCSYHPHHPPRARRHYPRWIRSMRIWRCYNDAGCSRGAWPLFGRSRTDASPAW